MTAAAKSQPAIGFLTAVEHAEFGIFGGYLILNPSGRPLEFHCTAPVKASRAQEILYGPTLRDYLYEQISPALLAKGKATPILVFTDSSSIMDSVHSSPIPLVMVAGQEAPDDRFVQFPLGANLARLPLSRANQQAELEQHWGQLQAGQLDLLEPFARVREALEEAQRAAANKAAA